MTSPGNLPVCVRLEPTAYEMLRERAEEAHGCAGGMALYVRRLVYEHLGLPLPMQYGDKKKLKAQEPKRPRGRPPKKKPAEEQPGAGVP